MKRTNSPSSKHLWETNHPFYGPDGSEVNHYKSWADFMEALGDEDDDMNVLFRWDWPGEDLAYCPPRPIIIPDDYYRGYTLRLFYLLPRWSRIVENVVDVCRADEPAVRAFLKRKFAYIGRLWDGITEASE